MANPNIASLQNMYGEVEHYSPTTTESSAIENSSNSDEIYQIESIHVANVNGTSGATANITIKHRKNVSGTPTEIHYADEISVSSQVAIEILSAPKWMLEDEDLRLTASADDALEVIVSYTRLS